MEYLTFEQAVDAGPFGEHCVMQPSGFCAPIVADFPAGIWQHEGDISATVLYFENITASAQGRVHY